jgi:hypothetical protein
MLCYLCVLLCVRSEGKVGSSFTELHAVLGTALFYGKLRSSESLRKNRSAGQSRGTHSAPVIANCSCSGSWRS